MNTLDFGNVGDAVGSFSVFAGFDLCLKGHMKANEGQTKEIVQADLRTAGGTGPGYLLCVSLGILHVHQHLAAARLQRLHCEHCRLHHLVAVRLDTCNQATAAC